MLVKTPSAKFLDAAEPRKPIRLCDQHRLVKTMYRTECYGLPKFAMAVPRFGKPATNDSAVDTKSSGFKSQEQIRPRFKVIDESSRDSGFGDQFDDLAVCSDLGFKKSQFPPDSSQPGPSGLDRLLSAPIVSSFNSHSESSSSSHKSSRKRLFQGQFKRNLSSDKGTNSQASPFTVSKRIRNDKKETDIIKKDIAVLPRCKSDGIIKSILNNDTHDLIGDFTKSLLLPTVRGKHADLRCIHVDTQEALLRGHYRETVENFLVVDCRYPYEYNGGHIRGAENIHTEEAIEQLFLRRWKTSSAFIIVFYCEFSSHRGPKMARHLRSQDRIQNAENYPQLVFPEIYLVEGGYKKFYEHYPQSCTPPEYVRMLDVNHKDELKFFRAKSKKTNDKQRRRHTSADSPSQAISARFLNLKL